MWSIEVIKVINDPKKYAKTKKQKKQVEQFRERTGFNIALDKKTGIESADGGIS